jgi:hypothetical protein
LDLAGGTALIIRRLIVPLTVAAAIVQAGQGFAQGAFPAPITGSAFERGSASPSQAGPSDECMKEFAPLREEAEQRSKLIKAASEQHASAVEACKLIGNFRQAEIKMIKYVESHAAKCGIPPQIADQLKAGHKNSENMQQKVCAVAQQVQQRGPSGPTGDFWTLPEKQL